MNDVQKQHDEDGDLTDMLGELRVLLPTAQLLSAFLVAVPFASRFNAIVLAEKCVFLLTFLLAMASLVLLTAPAVQHRLLRPLSNRTAFKQRASEQILLGAVSLAIALVLATQFVLSEVVGHALGTIAAGVVALLVLSFWWAYPRKLRARGSI